MKDRYLFRGKWLVNGGWVQGHYYNAPEYDDQEAKEIVSHYILDFDLNTDYHDRERLVTLSFNIDPETLGQCTGLKDKNGRLIFEGDVLKLTFKGDEEVKNLLPFYMQMFIEHNIVKVDFDGFGLNLKPNYYCARHGETDSDVYGNALEELLTSGLDIGVEIIGNVHDNPELLGG